MSKEDDTGPFAPPPSEERAPDPFQELERMFGGLLGGNESTEQGMHTVPESPEIREPESPEIRSPETPEVRGPESPEVRGEAPREEIRASMGQIEPSPFVPELPKAEQPVEETTAAPDEVRGVDESAGEGSGETEDADFPGPDLDTLVARIDAASAATTPGFLPVAGGEREEARTVKRLIVFAVGETRYGLEMGQVTEVGPVPPITPLPKVPPWLLGVSNLRGEILPVLDFRLFLGHSAEGTTDHHRMLVIQADAQLLTAGLVVDRVLGVGAIDPGAVLPPTAPMEDTVHQFLLGVTEQEDRLLAILDAKKLLTSSQLRRFAASQPNSASENLRNQRAEDTEPAGPNPIQ